jgi:ABC-type glycerol-3-phosphate transport system substrate-binding protein
MPLSIDTLALYYNKDIFSQRAQELDSEHRLDDARKFQSQIPLTWDDLVAYDKLLTKKNGSNISLSGIALGTANNIDNAQDILAAMMLQNQTQMISADKKSATFNLSTQKQSGELYYPGQSSLNFYTSFANPSKENYSWNNSEPSVLQAFIQGKTAMMINYSYVQNDILQQNPKLNYGIAPLPQIKGATQAIDYASYWVETVTKNSIHPKEAWDFVVYLANTGNGQYISATKKPSPYLVNSGLIPQSIEKRKDIASDAFEFQKMSAKSWYKGKRADKTDKIFIDLIENVVTRGQTIPIALDTAAAQETELLKQ